MQNWESGNMIFFFFTCITEVGDPIVHVRDNAQRGVHKQELMDDTEA